MMIRRQNACRLTGRFQGFLLRVVRGFRRNQGLLLAGAVAYYTLLSIVPLSILVPIVLTHFMEEQQLIHTLSTYLGMMIPDYAATLTEQVRAFLEHRNVVGIIGFLGMLFFSSLAFSMLENAMSVIFFQRDKIHRRYFLISAIIPYVYILAMGLGIGLVSFIVGAIETLESRHLTILGWNLNLGGATGAALYILGIVSEVLMFTSIYLVMLRGAGQVSLCAHRRNNRGGFMGDHPPGADLVLRGHIHRECHLQFHRHDGGVPSQHRGYRRNPAVWRPGHYRAGTKPRQIDR